MSTLFLVLNTNIYVEYKSVNDAESEKFMKQAIDLNYDLQVCFYRYILEKVTGKKFSVLFIIQEKKEPYLVNILEPNQYFLESGDDMWRTYLDVYFECLSNDDWYGYVKNEINSLGVPKWLQKQYENITIGE